MIVAAWIINMRYFLNIMFGRRFICFVNLLILMGLAGCSAHDSVRKSSYSINSVFSLPGGAELVQKYKMELFLLQLSQAGALKKMNEGEYKAAEEVLLPFLDHAVEALGEDHIHVLDARVTLALIYLRQNMLDLSIETIKKNISLANVSLGRMHKVSLTSEMVLGLLYEKKVLYADAIKQYENIVDAGQDSTQNNDIFFTAKNALALLYESIGNPRKSLMLFETMLEIDNREYTKFGTSILLAKIHYADLLVQLDGDLQYAQKIVEDLIDFLNKHFEATDALLLNSKGVLAKIHTTRASYELALYQLNNLLELTKNSPTQYLDTLGAIANVYIETGRILDAYDVLLVVIEHADQVYGGRSYKKVVALNNLAVVYTYQGELGKAESILQESTEIAKAEFGVVNSAYLVGMIALAEVYRLQGFGDRAYDLIQNITRSSESFLNVRQKLTLKNNLAALSYEYDSDYKKAEELLEFVVDYNDDVFGQEHIYSLNAKSNLASIYLKEGNYTDAELLIEEVLSIYHSISKDKNFTYINALNTYGLINYYGGEYSKGLDVLIEAKGLLFNLAGGFHPEVIKIQGNIISILLLSENTNGALNELYEMESNLRKYVYSQLASTEREETRRILLNMQSIMQNLTIHAAMKSKSTKAISFALSTIETWKRFISIYDSFLAESVRSGLSEEIDALSKAINRKYSQISSIANYSRVKNGDLNLLRKEIDVLERDLAELIIGHQSLLMPDSISVGEIFENLPSKSAFISIKKYSPIIDNEQLYEESPHWLVSIVSPDGDGIPNISMFDAGSVADVHVAIGGLSDNYKDNAAKIYKYLFGSAHALLSCCDSVYISSDGELDNVPFSGLMLPGGQYWLEEKSIHRVQSGRDVVARGAGYDNKAKGVGIISIGGIDYGKYIADEEDGVRSGHFSQLLYSGYEAESISQYFWSGENERAEFWYGKDATEERIKKLVHAPRVLHIATHGFFEDQSLVYSRKPLASSGLALASANTKKESDQEEDGVLYALEILGLNLDGTELVSLSACDTGRGQIDTSEGVYGMVRAFHIAGARSVLMSLWKLDDALSSDFMRDFYLKWFSDINQAPAKALREVKLEWLNSNDIYRRDPKYWAPYVLIEK